MSAPEGAGAALTGALGAGGVALVRAACTVLGAAQGKAMDPAAVLADAGACTSLLELLGATPALRAAVGAHAPDLEHRVCDPGPAGQQAAATLAGQVRGAVDAAREAERAARRAHRAAQRGTPEQRRAERAERAAESARSEAETARAAHREALAALEAARTQVREIAEELEAATALLGATRTQVETERRRWTDARALATALAGSPTQVLTEALIVVPEDVRELVGKWLPAVLGEASDPQAHRAVQMREAMSVRVVDGWMRIGGSSVLVCAGSTRVLVDAGIHPGVPGVNGPEGIAEVLAGGVDAVVITHAHLDHAGYVPAVLAACPGATVYATAATADLLGPMWWDQAKVAARSGSGHRWGEHVQAALGRLVAPARGTRTRVGALEFELFDSGHILGAAGVGLSDGTSRVVISGDVSREGQLSVGGWDLPGAWARPDLLVLEATSGARAAHTPRSRVVSAFVADVRRTVDAGGVVLVPAAALGRAQEVALLVGTQLPDVPVYVDGLARSVSEVFARHTGPTGRPVQVFGGQVRPVPVGRTADLATTTRGAVVVTTGAQMTGGPVLTWARHVLPGPDNLLALVGYLDPHSPATGLRAAMESGWWTDATGTVVPVDARVETYPLGAHASADELVTIATGVHAERTMLVHGDAAARAAIAGRLSVRQLQVLGADRRWTASLPASADSGPSV